MSFIKRIAIIGGCKLSPQREATQLTHTLAGQLGTPLLKALVDSGKFDLTAITRDGSKSSFPSNVS